MIVLDSEHPPVGMWFIGLDNKTDFMGCLQRKQGESDVFIFDFRFRHHRDDQVFDSEDVKHWYHTEHKKTTEDQAIHDIRDILLHLCESFPYDIPEERPRLDELLYRDYGNYKAFLEAFQNKPYAFAKMVSPGDEKEYGLNEAIAKS